MITVYGIRNCDTIKKTLNWLSQNDYPHQLHDYRKDGISEQLVSEFMKQFSLDELINRRGTTWRKLPEASRQDLTDPAALSLMVENPSLIKRPIIADGKHWLLGFDPEVLSRTLNS